MRGRAKFKKNEVLPDDKYNNINITLFIGKLTKDGKKDIASKILYQAIELAGEIKKQDGINVFETALKTLAPQVEVRSKRVGGATYQVPVEVRSDRKVTLAMRWLIEAAKNRGNKTFAESLADQFVQVLDGTGAAIKKREEVHRMAEANKAFAHYARF